MPIFRTQSKLLFNRNFIGATKESAKEKSRNESHSRWFPKISVFRNMHWFWSISKKANIMNNQQFKKLPDFKGVSDVKITWKYKRPDKRIVCSRENQLLRDFLCSINEKISVEWCQILKFLVRKASILLS